MKKIKFISLLFLSIFLLVIISNPIFAETSAGNYFNDDFEGESSSITSDVERDAYIFNRDIIVSGSTIGRSLIAAAYSATISKDIVGDSLRVAAENIMIEDTAVDNNITAASRILTITGNTTSNAIYGAAQDISVAGTTNALELYAQTVALNGTVNGDASISAESVTVGSNTVVTGTLEIESSNDPIIEDGATIGDLQVRKIVTENETPTLSETIMSSAIDIGYWTAVTIIIGFLFLLFAPNTTKRSAILFRDHPIALIVTGIASVIVIPILAFILIFPYLTLPLTFIIIGIYGVIMSIAVPFTAISVGKRFIPKMNKWLNALLFLVIFGILSRLPYVGLFIDLVCAVYAFGNITLLIYFNIKENFSTPDILSSDDDLI